MLLLLAYGAGRGASLAKWGRHLLEVFLHIGAHRTGTTALQRALWQDRFRLTRRGLACWLPGDTRGDLFAGLLDGPEQDRQLTERRINRSADMIADQMRQLAAQGCRQLLISEENILGSVRRNLRAGVLYPDLSPRLARFARIFGAQCTRVGMCIRPYPDYWASALAYAINAGDPVPRRGDLDRLVAQPSSWRQIVSQLAAAFPLARIVVWEFDRLKGRPAAQLRVLTGTGRGLSSVAGERVNASPDRNALRAALLARGDAGGAARIPAGRGRFMPFDSAQQEILMRKYRDDIAWLRGNGVGHGPAMMMPRFAGDTQSEMRGTA